jgi:hypothetical protein
LFRHLNEKELQLIGKRQSKVALLPGGSAEILNEKEESRTVKMKSEKTTHNSGESQASEVSSKLVMVVFAHQLSVHFRDAVDCAWSLNRQIGRGISR